MSKVAGQKPLTRDKGGNEMARRARAVGVNQREIKAKISLKGR